MPSLAFTSTQSWTVPADCQSIDSVAATGGGGNGSGGGSGFVPFHGGSGGPGGGGGAYGVSTNWPVTSGQVLTVYVGTAGGYSGLFNNTTGQWIVLAYSGNGQSGGTIGAANAVADNGASGAGGGGGSGTTGGAGGTGGGSPAYGGGGAGGGGGSSGGGGSGAGGNNWGGGGGGGGGGGCLGGTPNPGGGGGAGFQGRVDLSYTSAFPPSVSSVSPNIGQTVGGNSITITGSNFSISVVSQVLFGGVAAPSFVINSNTQITAINPAGTLGVKDVQVVNAYGTSPVNAGDQYTYNVTVWSDSATFSPAMGFADHAGVMRFASGRMSIAAALLANITSPQQFITIKFSPSTSIVSTFGQPKSLVAGFSAGTNLFAYIGAAKFGGALLQPSLTVAATANQKILIKAGLQAAPVFTPFLSANPVLHNFAKMSVSAVIPPPYAQFIVTFLKHWSIATGFGIDVFKAHFAGAILAAQVGISPNETFVPAQWANYGSEVLYASASGLEKAMIDVDAPRLVQMDVEAIIDTWDPYACPLPLLPYLAWEMGVTFWNDKWSEATKREWIAQQWQFKALRGTDAGISMAVDFAGRDISPYGYFVRDFITAPQGQFPSPGITHDQQEAWLATLPQVRVYLFQRPGLALADEFYITSSFIGTTTWDGQSFMTPSTAQSRLGNEAIWTVNGQDVPNVGVLSFGDYFQLQMPGLASVDEFYIDQSWLATDDELYDGTAFCTPNTAWKRLVTISPQTVAPYRIAVGPQLQAVQSQPELVTEPGVAGYDVFCGSNLFPYDGGGVFMAPSSNLPLNTEFTTPLTLPVFPSFFLPSTAQYRVFYRYAVYDPDNLPTGGTQGTMFCGVGWFGFPPFTAEVDVFMAGTRCSQEFSIGDFISPVSRFMVPQDTAPVAYVAGAIEAARGLTQLTLLQPKPTPLFSAGAPFIAGVDHYVVGQSQLSN